MFCSLMFLRSYSNGSIRRGSKNDASDGETLRSGLGKSLRDVKVFNREREKGHVFTKRKRASGSSHFIPIQHVVLLKTSRVRPSGETQSVMNLSPRRLEHYLLGLIQDSRSDHQQKI